jgi:hypothetical protein
MRHASINSYYGAWGAAGQPARSKAHATDMYEYLSGDTLAGGGTLASFCREMREFSQGRFGYADELGLNLALCS